MAKKQKFVVGDVIRYTGKFLRSIGMITGGPINGIVREVKGQFGGSTYLKVEWSDDDPGEIKGVLSCNVELDKRASYLNPDVGPQIEN